MNTTEIHIAEIANIKEALTISQTEIQRMRFEIKTQREKLEIFETMRDLFHAKHPVYGMSEDHILTSLDRAIKECNNIIQKSKMNKPDDTKN